MSFHYWLYKHWWHKQMSVSAEDGSRDLEFRPASEFLLQHSTYILSSSVKPVRDFSDVWANEHYTTWPWVLDLWHSDLNTGSQVTSNTGKLILLVNSGLSREFFFELEAASGKWRQTTTVCKTVMWPLRRTIAKDNCMISNNNTDNITKWLVNKNYIVYDITVVIQLRCRGPHLYAITVFKKN